MADVLGWLSGILSSDPEAAGSAQNSMAMQPAVLDYLQDVVSGRIAAGGALQRRPYDPALSYRENVPDLRASLEQAMPVALGFGPGAIRAYHYSPADFAKFDAARAGSTTDPGMMGKALYFSTDPAVAKAGPHRYEVDLHIKNPVHLEHPPDWRTSTKSDLIGQSLEIPPPTPGMLALSPQSKALPEWQDWAGRITNAAKNRGHDAAILDYSPTGYKHQEVAVYDPSLIELLRKYGILAPVAGTGAAALSDGGGR